MGSYTFQEGKRLSAFFIPFITAISIIFMLQAPLNAHAVPVGQDQFSSPDDAIQALILAVKADDADALQHIFGSAGKELLASGDASQDRTDRETFLQAYEKKNLLRREGDTKAILHVGEEQWPFPIPIAKKGTQWFFDAQEGSQELINRRIGKNELTTIQICLAYVDAQREYAAHDRNADGILEYAQKFTSSPGKKDGLYWKAEAGGEESPFGDLAAQAAREGYKKTDTKPVPYHGYYFTIIKAQGAHAPGGAYDYILNGKMIGGFGMAACPAEYGVSGVMTFIVNHDGIVYEKDLGGGSGEVAQRLLLFDPDATWKKVKDPQ